MELCIEMVCPQCNEPLSLNIRDLAPGRRQECSFCKTSGRLTAASLDRFSRDLRVFCES